MAYENLKNFIMRKLGYPVVKVYLTDKQIDDCIWEAIDRYFEYRNKVVKEYYMSGTAGKNIYDIPPTIVPKFIEKVIFKPTDPLMSITGVMQDVYILYYMQSAGGASNFILDYWMTLASYEEYVRVLGNQPHWEIINENQIKLDPTPSIDFKIGIKYTEIPEENVIENIRWIRLYSLALAKAIEGEIRSKYGSFTAGSGEVSLNGADLKNESKEEVQILLDELMSKSEPLGMIVG